MEQISNTEWLDETLPRSPRFGDTYYSKTDGLAESRHVFLAGNHLPQRFAALVPGKTFTIAETGFGTGLNFLATLELWRETAPAGAELAFHSFELYPLTRQEIARALSRWPELALPAGPLLAAWNPQGDGFEYRDGKVALTVHFGDANAWLPRLEIIADAWFLDGFSPAKNPELWNADLLQAVHDRTVPGGTFATYTAAGWVRRNLAAAGFAVTRLPGHGGKREMMAGRKG
ncbi:MAG: tRNA (5-methylaminomethyl-2-thiouridine)(34)-methyltransferase MnmD [Hyphomicrobiales bacterium]|nr:tRNA (5-methylaminomethyl-2-thiouridine)(34)-methyltransferase MnmD [Nitratireductor sp.]MCC2096460.1 tRNA (5-methylaminomethyl-2-thiouridine)(34)-methyltransferase MnmD [Hyphomicrobiales bacterium]